MRCKSAWSRVSSAEDQRRSAKPSQTGSQRDTHAGDLHEIGEMRTVVLPHVVTEPPAEFEVAQSIIFVSGRQPLRRFTQVREASKRTSEDLLQIVMRERRSCKRIVDRASSHGKKNASQRTLCRPLGRVRRASACSNSRQAQEDVVGWRLRRVRRVGNPALFPVEASGRMVGPVCRAQFPSAGRGIIPDGFVP